MKKLYKNGIRIVIYDLIKNYLANRLQDVRVTKIRSRKRKVKIGVPQGTILGLLLFILYVNDIVKILPAYL